MNFVKSMIKPAFLRMCELQVNIRLSHLRNTGIASTQKLANAIDAAIEESLSPEEEKWVSRIEEKRQALNGSSENMSITDFGAGLPDSNRTADEMYQGVMTEMTVGEICKIASKPHKWALILFKLIREFKPTTCIELGTCLGISAAYQASAQKLNEKGRLISLEGAAPLASIAGENLKQLGLDNTTVVSGRFQDTLEHVLDENRPIDYAFIDGHHDERATLSYFEQFLPHKAEESIFVFDDIAWSEGMRRAWRSIQKHDAVRVSVDLGIIGICVLDAKIETKHKFKLLLKMMQ